MSRSGQTGAGPGRPAPVPPRARGADAQILATWQALRANPDLDAGCAMQAIDRLLDQRARPAGAQIQAVAASHTPEPGSPLQRAVLSSVLRILLSGEAG